MQENFCKFVQSFPSISLNGLVSTASAHNGLPPQEYAQVIRMLGNGRLEAQCIDGKKRLCHIRGKMRKKVWVAQVGLSTRFRGKRTWIVKPAMRDSEFRYVLQCCVCMHVSDTIKQHCPSITNKTIFYRFLPLCYRFTMASL